ncbi:MAG: peptidylglycine alpha-amidating monooxygenase [Dehalococcoidia bacterium]|nr:peptidylglycine alpha-amidating monooxygenase [Dehalococcoidia bacterium]
MVELTDLNGFEPVNNWAKIPHPLKFIEATSVAVDSVNNVYVFNRGINPIMIFNKDGDFIDTWGEGKFTRPHSIFIDDEDFLYLVDDGGHCVYKMTSNGDLIFTLGIPGNPSPWQEGGMFNRPTDLAIDSDKNLYVSDGYGNSRIHKFDNFGNHVLSWGESGSDPGQFSLPHNITFHEEGFLVVCDRENFRVQFFDTNGSFVRQIHFHRPQAICSGKGVFSGKLIISEAGSPSLNQSNVPNLGNLIKIIDFDGKEICRFGNSLGGELPDQFISPHGITQDNDGNIYVAEVSYTAYGSKLNPPQEVVSLRKWKPKYH